MKVENYTPGQRKRFRTAFVLVIGGLLLQFVLVLTEGEFFPAYVLPMFKTVNGQQGEFRTLDREIVVRRGEKKRTLSMEELFPNMSESSRFHVLYHRMGPVPEQQIRGGRNYAEWLQQHLCRVTSWAEIESFGVDWYQVTVRENEGKREWEKVKIGRYEMQWEGESEN